MKKSITKNSQETQKLGQNFVAEILTAGIKDSAIILALSGDLGAGKTTFLQGFAKGLKIKENILSPTFVIMKKFKILHSSFKFFYHFDLYRLENETNLEFLGFKEIIKNPENIIAIEWPEKILSSLRAERSNLILIQFDHLKENQRKLTISR